LTFYVGVQVSGGETGTRESILTENGKRLAFDTREAAEAEVRAYIVERNAPHAKATFAEWVQPTRSRQV
jgi:hypothetical protein